MTDKTIYVNGNGNGNGHNGNGNGNGHSYNGNGNGNGHNGNGNGNGKTLNGNGNGNGQVYANGNGNGTYVYTLPLVPQSTTTENEEGLDLGQILTVIKQRMPVIIFVAVGVTSAVGWWTFHKQPVYEGKFQILIEPATNTKNNLSQLVLLGPEFSGSKDYDTQIEVLKSPSVLEPILEELSTKYPDVQYKEVIKENESKSPLKIEQLEKTKILEISFEDTDPKKIKYVLDQIAQGYLKYSLNERQAEVKQGIDFVNNQLPSLQKKVDTLQAKLQKFRQQHNLIDPEEQAKILSANLIDMEKEHFNTQVQLNETLSLYTMLQRQIGLDPQQALAASYLTESPRYQNLLNQLQEVEVEIAKQSAVFLGDSPEMQTLQDKRNNILPLIQQELQNVLGPLETQTSNNPAAASPSNLRLDLNKQYIESANQIKILEIREGAMGQAITTLKQHIEQMPLIARQYTDIQRELVVSTDSLNRLLAAEEKLQLEAAQQALPWQLLSAPREPDKPVYPKPSRTMGLGVVAGLILGLGAALLADRLDPVFHSTDELKDNIPLPLLGLIPGQKNTKAAEPMEMPRIEVVAGGLPSSESDAKTKKSRKKKNYNSTRFLESFRSLYTNIRLLGSDSSINSLVVSSAAPGEGKSTIAVNLAQAAAAMGQKVLLVDADLRRPQVHVRLNLHNDRGLSSVIATGLDLESAIQKVPHWDNLYVMACGPIPPDPTRILSSKRMQQVMNQLITTEGFDLVIYDTPPLLGFADAKILACRTSGVVLVAKMGKTARTSIKQTVEQLKLSQVSILGLVANNVTRHNQDSYYYYDHYYGNRQS